MRTLFNINGTLYFAQSLQEALTMSMASSQSVAV